jgi:hypothetical protein
MEAANGIVHETELMAAEHGDSIDWLVDLTRLTGTTSRARKKLTEAIGHPSVRKFAFFGASTFARVMVNFISAASGKKQVRFFGAEEHAIAWLEEGRRNGDG